MMMQSPPIVQPYPDVLKQTIIDIIQPIPPLPKLPSTLEFEKPAPASPVPAAPSTKPPEKLQELQTIERLLITKRLRVKNVMFLRGKKNRFFVRTPAQNLVYTIEEENRWWVGYCCYGLRPLILKVCNDLGVEVIRIVRPYAFTSRVVPCHLQRLKVYSPPEQLIGSVMQQWTPIKPLYLVQGVDGDTRFIIQGPCITVSCYNEIRFDISDAEGTPVGFTSKRWQGLMHALFYAPVSDKFSVTFDVNLSNEDKGLLLAATLLMDYMYYDS